MKRKSILSLRELCRRAACAMDGIRREILNENEQVCANARKHAGQRRAREAGLRATTTRGTGGRVGSLSRPSEMIYIRTSDDTYPYVTSAEKACEVSNWASPFVKTPRRGLRRPPRREREREGWVCCGRLCEGEGACAERERERECVGTRTRERVRAEREREREEISLALWAGWTIGMVAGRDEYAGEVVARGGAARRR